MTTQKIEQSLFETSYMEIRRRAAARLEADLKPFIAKYDAELDDVDGDEFRVLITAAAEIQKMLTELKRPTLEERLDEIEKRLNRMMRPVS